MTIAVLRLFLKSARAVDGVAGVNATTASCNVIVIELGIIGSELYGRDCAKIWGEVGAKLEQIQYADWWTPIYSPHAHSGDNYGAIDPPWSLIAKVLTRALWPYHGTIGKQYRGIVTVYAKDANGEDSRGITTYAVWARK